VHARLASEKRVTALLLLAVRNDLPDSAYASLASRNSVKINTALVNNTSLPTFVKLNFMENFVRVLDNNGSYNSRELVNSFVAADPEVALALAKETTSPGVALALVSGPHKVADGQVDAIIDRLDSIQQATAADRSYCYGELVESLAEQDLSASQLAKLRKTVNRLIKRWDAGYYDDTKRMLSAKGREVWAKTAELAVSTSLSRSKSLVAALLGSRVSGIERSYRSASLRAMARNKVLPVEAYIPYLDEFETQDYNAIIADWLSRGELDAVARHLLDCWIAPQWFEDLVDPLPLVSATLDAASASGGSPPVWLLRHPSAFSSPQRAVEALPWKYITALDTAELTDELGPVDATTAGPADVVRVAREMLLDSLGDDAHSWEVFSQLADEFEGTLPDLLFAAANI
jgi:hypothetical protein